MNYQGDAVAQNVVGRIVSQLTAPAGSWEGLKSCQQAADPSFPLLSPIADYLNAIRVIPGGWQRGGDGEENGFNFPIQSGAYRIDIAFLRIIDWTDELWIRALQQDLTTIATAFSPADFATWWTPPPGFGLVRPHIDAVIPGQDREVEDQSVRVAPGLVRLSLFGYSQ